jgi:beta-lactamase regulating signal transducer with metallopeptidase domain
MSEQLLLTIVDASLRAVLLAAGVGALLVLLRIPRGAARHGAWLVVVVAMLAMPLLQRLAPALPRVPAPPVLDVAALLPASPPSQSPSRIASPDPLAIPPATATEQLPSASPSTTEPASRPAIAWLQLAGAAYALITLTLLLRLADALRRVRKFMGSAVPIGDGLYESQALATPVTVGAIRPRIVLPATWSTWSETTRDAVMAHERAHAQRRDPLVALLTRLNVCIFWFHPLAWWLERTLADAAEQACDEIAVRAVPQPREYAEALLMMATASRQAGGRIAWAGVRAEGSGRLSARIDRILEGSHVLSVSGVRKRLALAASVTAVVIVVACRTEQPAASLEPLVREVSPETAAQIREGERRAAAWKAAHAMSWDQVAELETAWKRNREDLATLEKLLFFYEPDISGKRTPDDARKIAGRRPLILWFIEHHPDFEFHRQLPARIFGRTDWLMDPAGYDAAKKLWLAHAARPDVSAETLRNAASFLDVEDKPLAERLLLQGQRRDRDPGWSARLGRLYAQAIVGSNRFTLGNVISSTDPVAARGEYATRVRAMLDESRDPVLLSAAGGYLARNAGQTKVDFDHRALARTYLQRAIQLDPNSEAARYALDWLDIRDQNMKEQGLFAGVGRESIPGVIAKLPEDERLPILVKRAGLEYMSAELANWQATQPQTPDEKSPRRIEENRQKALAARQRSKEYAADALALAERLPQHPDHTDALFTATIALGANAFWDGDRDTAVRHMLTAADVPPATSNRLISPTLNASLEMKLIGALLKYGERDTVIEYFEKSAKTRPAERERLLAAAAAIRNGKQPGNYYRR